ncbi:CpXC domain-containing protein [Leisingera daeponensis]|uniref:CpXC domain-containing protein n=1 Tax=Leisingera daeponensis TaxID=405746 RepID=A0ABS7NFZ9_9RHOB|nr:CpXC domain-containing protein [Leisingera daeponensis]MBY6056358.1 CpXC domain-containing protein [Leisingera daeponensis]MBY6140128.1 CpXC domain-containing protein [Leisingera daeponensis]
MSLFHPVNLVCPRCEAPVTMMAVGSVNADRRPDLRDDILEDRFQDCECDSCGESFRLQPQFNYLDAGRGQWIAAMPASRLRDHLELEDEAKALFDSSYGASAPAAARSVGSSLAARLTFGWPAVREKLLVKQLGLDDVIVEMMKLHILRSVESVPMAEGIELRLVEADDEADGYVFAWLETGSEQYLEYMTIPAELYRAIQGNPEGWGAIRARLENGYFVDMQKLYMGEGRQAG